MSMSTYAIQMLIAQAWQIAVVALVTALIVRLCARHRPHLAHALWLIVLIKCVTPPVWGHSLGLMSQIRSVLPAWDAEADRPEDPHAAEVTTIVTLDASHLVQNAQTVAPDDLSRGQLLSSADIQPAPLPQPREPTLPSWLYVVAWMLLAGVGLSLMVLVLRYAACVYRIRLNKTDTFDEELAARIGRLSQQLRLKRVPRVIVSDVPFGPAVLGFFRHTIVLPECLLMAERVQNQRPAEERKQAADIDRASGLSYLDPVLAHELLHIRRGELLTGMLQALCGCLWWFHPAVWFVNRLLSRQAEYCCDQQVLSELGCSPGQYARSLLQVIESKQPLKPVPVFPGMKPVEITAQRMERIMLLKNGSPAHVSLWTAAVALLFAIIILPGAVTGQQPDSDTVTKPPSVNSDTAQLPAAPPPAVLDNPSTVSETTDLLTLLSKRRATLRFNQARLPVCLSHISAEHGVNIVFHDDATSHTAELKAKEITLEVTDISLEAALTLLLHPLDLRWQIEGEAIHVVAADTLTTRVYSFRGLFDSPQDAETQLQELANLITTTIKPSSWNESRGSIHPYVANESLVVRHTEAVHERIAALLQYTRKQQTEGLSCRVYNVADLVSVVPGATRFNPSSNSEDSARLALEYAGPPIPAPVAGEAPIAEAQYDFAPLLELISVSTDLDGTPSTITCNQHTLNMIVHASAKKHDQIASVLSQLRSGLSEPFLIEAIVLQVDDHENKGGALSNTFFNRHGHGAPWKMMTAEQLQATLNDSSAKVLLNSKMTTPEASQGQMITSNPDGKEIRLQVTAQRWGSGSLLMLACGGEIRRNIRHNDPLNNRTAIIPNGQTLLLDITPVAEAVSEAGLSEVTDEERSADDGTPGGRIIAAFTVRHMESPEEEEALLMGTRSSADVAKASTAQDSQTED
jgi:beta-lactamase regulating signal transducer with metallopeptidase domain